MICIYSIRLNSFKDVHYLRSTLCLREINGEKESVKKNNLNYGLSHIFEKYVWKQSYVLTLEIVNDLLLDNPNPFIHVCQYDNMLLIAYCFKIYPGNVLLSVFTLKLVT